MILRLRNMTALDATGLHALEEFTERLRKTGRFLLLCGARDQPSKLIGGSEFLEHVGSENVLPNIRAALARAADIQSAFAGVGNHLAREMGRSTALTICRAAGGGNSSDAVAALVEPTGFDQTSQAR